MDTSDPTSPERPEDPDEATGQTDRPERPSSPDVPEGPAGREGQGDAEQDGEQDPDASDAGHRPGDAGEQPVPEQAPGSMGGDNGGA